MQCSNSSLLPFLSPSPPSPRSTVSFGAMRCWWWTWRAGSRRWWSALSRRAAANVTASTSSTRCSAGSPRLLEPAAGRPRRGMETRSRPITLDRQTGSVNWLIDWLSLDQDRQTRGRVELHTVVRRRQKSYQHMYIIIVNTSAHTVGYSNACSLFHPLDTDVP